MIIDVYLLGFFYEQDFIDVKIFIWACKLKKKEPQINPLHPNMNIHILPTVLYTFHKVLAKRIFF